MFSLCEYESFLHTQEFKDQISRVLDDDKVKELEMITGTFCIASKLE